MGTQYSNTLLRRIEWLIEQGKVFSELAESLMRVATAHRRALEDLSKKIIESEKEFLREGSLASAWPGAGSALSAKPSEDFEQPVLEVQIDVLGNGEGRVTIDGGWPFSLSRKLTCLLLHAAAADHHLVDNLPAFRSLTELKQTVSEFAGSDLGNLVYRLREVLAAQHWPRGLLQTDKRRDGCYVRFRARRLVISGRLPRDWHGAFLRQHIQDGSA